MSDGRDPAAPALIWTACAAVFVVTLAYRFLSLIGFSNDHYVHLAAAAQMLRGEWPTRDFVDPGMPMMYAASAAVQALAGGGLLSEAILVASAFAAAAAMTLRLGWRLTGTLAAPAAATAFQVTLYPRTYSYPKILLYVLGTGVMIAYRDRPTLGRLLVMAGVAVLAFLFRHDHGLFIGGAALVTIALAPQPPGMARLNGVAWYAIAVLALLTPYLAYLAVNGGVGKYVRTAWAFSAAEAERNPPVVPSFTARDRLDRHCAAGALVCGAAANAPAVLYYAYYALPLAALVMMRRDDAPIVVPLVVLALAVNVSFLRDALSARLADVAAPASLLLAVVLARLWTIAGSPGGRRAARTVAAAACALLLTSSVLFGRTAEHLREAGMSEGPAEIAERLQHRAANLLDPRQDRRGHPSRLVTGLAPHFDYIDRCFPPGQRLFVPDFAPDLFVYARRPFAGGSLWIIPGYFEADGFQREVVGRLERQEVALAVVRLPAYEKIAREFPLIDSHLQRRFAPMLQAPLTDGDSFRLLVNRSLSAARVDGQTGLPCYR